MSVTLTPTPAAPVSVTDFVSVAVAGADAHTVTGYSGTEVSTAPGTPVQYPSEPAVVYYLTFEEGGVIYGKSYEFTPSTDGDHEFNSYMFPHAGSWTIRLNKASDDSSVQTAAVTVS